MDAHADEDDVASLLGEQTLSHSIFASLATPTRPSPAQRALALFPFRSTPSPRQHQLSSTQERQAMSNEKLDKVQHDEACYIDCEKRFDMIAKLPVEISAYIVTFLDSRRDLIAMSTVSRTWYGFARESRVWHQLFLNHSSAGWSVSPEAEVLWRSRLLGAYEGKWNEQLDGAEHDEDEKVHRETSEYSPVSQRLQDLFRSHMNRHLRSSDEDESPIVDASQRHLLRGSINWFLMYKARFELTHRWGLSNAVLDPLSQAEADEAEEEGDSLGSDDPATDYLGEFHNDPAAASHLRAILRTPERSSRVRSRLPNAIHRSSSLNPDVSYLKGHQDSIYCVRLDSRPLTLPEDVEFALQKRYERAPLYDRTATLGIGSRGLIYSGSRDRLIKIWDGDSGMLLHTLSGHNGSVLCLTFDEDVLLSGSSDKTVIVWDLKPLRTGKTPEQVTVLHGHTAGVLDVAMTDRWIISCGKDATVRVYDREAAFTCVHVYRQHRGPVNAGSLSVHEGKVCAVTASGEGGIQLWEVESARLVRTLEGHTKGLACVKFIDDIVVSGSKDLTVRVWNATTGACLAVCPGHRDLVRAIAFDVRRKIIVSAGYDGQIKMFDVQRLLHPDAAVVEGGMTVAAMADVPPLSSTGTEAPLQDRAGGLTAAAAAAAGNGAGRLFDVQMDGTRIVSCGENMRICVRDFARNSPIMRLLA